MKGTERKCLVASAVTHGLLVVMLLIASAFVPEKPREETISFILTSIPDMIIDEPNLMVGGNPNTGVPEPEPPQPVPRIEPPPVRPEPIPARIPEPEPVKPIVPSQPPPKQFNLTEATTRKASPKPEPRFDLSKARKTIKPAAPARIPENRDSALRETQLATSMSRLRTGMSSGIGEIDVPGPGGPAYASYNLVLRKFYEDAWRPPQVATDNEPIVEVEVTIARDGRVLAARITKKSGKRELDASVQTTLDRVKKVAPFPSGSKDEKRIFNINFNLSSKLNL
jgi:TonB family protein